MEQFYKRFAFLLMLLLSANIDKNIPRSLKLSSNHTFQTNFQHKWFQLLSGSIRCLILVIWVSFQISIKKKKLQVRKYQFIHFTRREIKTALMICLRKCKPWGKASSVMKSTPLEEERFPSRACMSTWIWQISSKLPKEKWEV